MALNLGDVSIGLVADTSGLQAAMGRLKDFGNAVNALSRKTDEESQRMANAFARQERILSQTFTKIDTQVANLRRTGADPQIIAQLTRQYNHLQESLMKGERTSIELARAREYGVRILNRATNAIKANVAAQTQAINIEEKLAAAKRKVDAANSKITSTIGPEKSQSFIAANNSALAAYEAKLRAADVTTHSLKTATAQLTSELAANKQAWQRTSESIVSASKARSAYVQAENRVRGLQSRMGVMGADPRAADLIKQADVALARHEENLRKNRLTTTQLTNSKTELSRSLGRITREWNSLTNAVKAADAAERARERAVRVTASTNRQLRLAGLPQTYQQDISNTLRQYEAALRGTNLAQITATHNAWKEAVDRGRNAMTGAGTAASKFSSHLRDVGRSLILVVGPLSGIGARVAVLSTLFETLSWKMALSVGSMTASIVGLGALVVAGVKATMMMERWYAQMLLATGAQSTMAASFEYVTNYANKMGQSIVELTPAYTKFAAAARMSGLALEEQQAAFEGIVTAGTALRATPEQVSRMFLAMEQMVSKGTVHTEEIKRQLGDVLPGAVQIAAQAMGVTTSKFMDMMQKGEVATKDFLPKFSALLKELFGPAALQGAESLQSEINRVSNSWLELKKRLDEASNASEGFRAVLQSFNKVLITLGDNIPQLVGGLGAIMGVAAGLGVWWVVASARAVQFAGGLMVLTKAVRAFNLAATGSAALALLGGPAGLARLAIVATGAAVGYKLMSDAMSDTTEASSEFRSALKADVELYEKLGSVSANVSKTVLENAQLRIEAAMEEVRIITRARELLTATAADGPATTGTASMFNSKMSTFGAPGKVLGLLMDKVSGAVAGVLGIKGGGGSEEAAALDKRKALLQENIKALEGYVERWKNIKVTKDPVTSLTDPNGDGGKGALDSFKNRLQDMIDEYETAKRKAEIVSRGGSFEAFLNEDSMNKAREFLRDLPKGLSEADIKAKLLSELGIEADSAAEALNKLFLATKLFDEQTADFDNWSRNAASRINEYANTIEQFQERMDTAGGVDVRWSKIQIAAIKELQKEADRFDELFKFSALKNDPAAYKQAKDTYLDYVRTVQQAEMSAYWSKEMADIAKSTGIAMESVTLKFDNAIAQINEGILSGFVDAVKGGVMIGKIELEKFNAVIKEQLEPFKELTSAIDSWADKTTDTLANLIVNGTKDWKEQIKQLENAIMMDITKMIVKQGITEPLFKALFGDLLTSDKNKTGSLGGFGGGLLGMIFGQKPKLGYDKDGNAAPKVDLNVPSEASGALEDGIFGGFLKGVKGMAAAFMNFLSGLSSIFASNQATGAVGGKGGGGGFLGLIGSFFGGAGGIGYGEAGTAAATAFVPDLAGGFVPALAAGGPAFRDKTYQVNENVPELYTVGSKSYLLPRGNGFVKPLDEYDGGMNNSRSTTIHAPITIVAKDYESFRRSSNQVSDQMAKYLRRAQRIN